MYIKRSPVEIQPPTHWHRVQHDCSAVCVIAQQYPSLTCVSLHFCYPHNFFFFCVFKNCASEIANLELRKSGVIAFPKGTDKLASPLVTPNIEVVRFACMKVIEF